MNYIIDGYNLGFSDQQIKPWIQRGDIDRAIQMIIHKVQILVPENSKIVLVFDGKHGYFKKKFGTTRTHVVFSKKPETADDIIRRIIKRESQPQLWSVVSSDLEIRNTALAMGAKSVKSTDFLLTGQTRVPRELSDNEPDIKYNPDKQDMDYWLKQFKEKNH